MARQKIAFYPFEGGMQEIILPAKTQSKQNSGLQNKPQGFKSQAPLAESKMGKSSTPQPNDGKSKKPQAYVFEGGIRIME